MLGSQSSKPGSHAAIVQEPFSLAFFWAMRNLEATLAGGITAIRDAGGADLGVKEAVERGWIKGPVCRSRSRC